MLPAGSPSAPPVGSVLLARLAGFTGFLRANGFGVGNAESLDTLELAERGGLLEPRLLKWSLKALLCGRGEEWGRFDELFDAYFLPPNKRTAVETRPIAGDRFASASASSLYDRSEGTALGSGDAAAANDAHGSTAKHGASRSESLAQADFRYLNRPDDVRDIEALMRRFVARLKPLQLRREHPAARGATVHLPRVLRRSVETGGVPLRLAWRAPTRVRPRLVLLLDVSRSMSLYSFFYLRFARALTGLLPDVYCFIFHTRLTGVSEALRDADPWRSQQRLEVLSAGWAGGTRIGETLAAFNRGHAARLVHSRTAVIVVSDGYDTGEPALLSSALAKLKRRARRLVWINPQAGQPGFTPVSRGMQAALPYLDALVPGADLAALERALPSILRAL